MFKFRKWEVCLKATDGYDVLEFTFSNYDTMTNFIATALAHNTNLKVTIIELTKTESSEQAGDE
jgi:hypothetical protein